MSEWVQDRTRSVVGTSSGWYVSSGYHIAKFTPYATYAKVRADSKTSDPGLTLSQLPPAMAVPAAGLNDALNAILASSPSQKTISAGSRWDFIRNADLKLQVDHTRLGEGSAGTLVNLQSGFERGSAFTLFSVAINFVF